MHRAEMFAGDPPERGSVEPQPINIEEKRVVCEGIYNLRLLLEADVTEPSTPGLSELRYKAAFNDQEQKLIKSKIFKLIAKL